MRMYVTVHGEDAWTLDPEEEAEVREILDKRKNVATELAYIFDCWLSDVDTDTDAVIEEEDGTLLWEGEL